MTHLSDLIAALRKGDGNGCRHANALMQEAADALRANQGAIVNSIIERARHTPTDDEREAPIAEVAEAFRQHEGAPTWQDDPVGRDAALRWHMRGYKDGLAAGFRRSEVPSAECASCQGECGGGRHCCENCVHTQPQGEPSDAQVQAALDASVAYYSTTWVGKIDPEPVDFDAMRAALRAARGAR